MNRLFILLLLLPLLSCNLLKQATLATDPRTDALILEGKQAMRSGNYMDAWDAFEIAREREFNRSSTVAIYLAGFSAYKLGYDDIAKSRFSTIVTEFPKSRYVEDANYHMALLALKKKSAPKAQFAALSQLLDLQSEARDPNLKDLALAKWRSYLFDTADRDLLDVYVGTVPALYQAYVMEALVYRILEEDGPLVAKLRLDNYKQDGGKMTTWLNSLFPNTLPPKVVADPRWKDPNLIKIGLVLPFQLDQRGMAPAYLQEIPESMVRPLEFYEGFRMAVDEYQASGNKRVFLSVIDSRRDTIRTRQLYSKLDSQGIQVLVGDVYNAQSRVLSEWAESRKVPQIVPLSPSEELVENKRYTFLANPTAMTHGASMAEYAFESMGLRHMYIFTDNTSATQELLQGFRTRFQAKGGTIDTLLFSQNFDDVALSQIPKLARSIPANTPNTGVYIPIMGNEEASSLILNILQNQGKNLPVLGSPHFRSNYPSITSDTKANFNLIFSTSYLIEAEDEAYASFYQKYLKTYYFPPSEFAVQGYDIGKYVLKQLSSYNPSLGMDLASFLRVSPGIESLHLPYQFRSQQSNQQVNLGQYTEMGILKLK
ncbi:MAG: ABC transporter substrate-binding protein [Bacteroidia bacterium]|nr:ABC transporter substrate-binding protein [Bacteroidia bacterium]